MKYKKFSDCKIHELVSIVCSIVFYGITNKKYRDKNRSKVDEIKAELKKRGALDCSKREFDKLVEKEK